MAKTRRDDRGRVLRKGEIQRASDKRYMYTYTDPLGRRKYIYANDLAELREKEKKLIKDQMDGLDLYVAGKATVNDTFDRYLSTKFQLRETTRSNYIYIVIRFSKAMFRVEMSSRSKPSRIAISCASCIRPTTTEALPELWLYNHISIGSSTCGKF